MKTYIPKQPRHARERIEVRLDERLVRRLEKYCQYLDSDRDYVLSQALELVFRKDRDFAVWLGAQATPTQPENAGKRRSAAAGLSPSSAGDVRSGGTD